MLKNELIAQIETLTNMVHDLNKKCTDLSVKYVQEQNKNEDLTNELKKFKFIFSNVFKNQFIRDNIKDIVREMMEDDKEVSITNRMENIFDYKLDQSGVQYRDRSYED